jgi:hypothetical protein
MEREDHMTRDQLILLSTRVYDEGKKREGLGGYSADADSLLFLHSAVYNVVQHLIEKEKKPRKRKKKR